MKSAALSLVGVGMLALIGGCSDTKAPPPPSPAAKAALSQADPQMTKVLNALMELNPKPIETLSAQEARKQPTATDAVMKVLKDEGKPTAPEPVGDVAMTTATAADGSKVPVRVYTPKGDGPFPAIVYARGGGWVIATLDTYDASCRALCNMVGAVVVSVDYRVSPEHKFPAAHEDVYAVTQWVVKDGAAPLKVDPKRVAIVGESAGGNMAAAACMMAKERGGAMPVHQVLVYPVGGTTGTESQRMYADAKPLNTPMITWFTKNYTNGPADLDNKHLAIVKATAADLAGLPPATVITAQIDPLMSEGKMYADHLKAAGVDVAYQNYNGVTHEFFGMGAVLDKAKAAEMFAAQRLKSALMK